MHFGYRDDPCEDCIEAKSIDGQMRWVCTMNCGPKLSVAEDPNPTRVHVAYVDPATGWSATLHDRQGNQIGDAEFAFHKRHAQLFALHMAGWREAEGRALPIHVFKKTGALMEIRQPPQAKG